MYLMSNVLSIVFVGFLFCYALLCVLSNFSSLLNRKRKLVAFVFVLSMSYYCECSVSLQCVIVVFPDNTH